MARGSGTQTIEAPSENGAELTDEQKAALETKREQRRARRALRSYIVVPMPANMKAIFEGEAKDADKPAGTYLRDLLASQRGIEIPVTVVTRRHKYATDEERDAAKLARRQTRSTTMKNLMAAFNQAKAQGMSAEQAYEHAGRVVASGGAELEAAPA